MNKPLSGIRVIELATFIAVPACARFMADLGAEVIKIESSSGDPIRFTAAHEGRPRTQYENTTWDLENANKRGLVLDLKSEAGMSVLHRLLKSADVFLTNWRPAALKRANLDYESVHSQFPGLIYGHVTGYGEDGPDQDLPGFDFTAFFARSGILGSIYPKESAPMNLIPGMGDHQAGMFLCAGVTAALFQAKITGIGEKVSTSLMHSAIYTQGVMLQAAQYTDLGQKYPIRKEDSDNPLNCAYRTKDGRYIQLSMPPFNLYRARFMELIGRPDLSDSPRYTIENITDNHLNAEFFEIVAKQFLLKDSSEWKQILTAGDIPFSLAQVWEEVLADPQAWATDCFYQMQYDNGNTRILVRPPIHFKEMGLPEYNRAPLMGEDSEAVLTDLGYTPDEIELLHKSKIIYTWDDFSAYIK